MLQRLHPLLLVSIAALSVYRFDSEPMRRGGLLRPGSAETIPGTARSGMIPAVSEVSMRRSRTPEIVGFPDASFSCMTEQFGMQI